MISTRRMIALRILDVLESQKFYKWHQTGGFMEWMDNPQNLSLKDAKEKILAEIESMFNL